MQHTSQFVVVAEFDLEPANREEFVKGLLANRRETVTTEPGCRQYEICIPHEYEDKVFLIEFYDSRAAFDSHHVTPHWQRWHDTVGHLIKSNRVTFMSRRLEAAH